MLTLLANVAEAAICPSPPDIVIPSEVETSLRSGIEAHAGIDSSVERSVTTTWADIDWATAATYRLRLLSDYCELYVAGAISQEQWDKVHEYILAWDGRPPIHDAADLVGRWAVTREKDWATCSWSNEPDPVTWSVSIGPDGAVRIETIAGSTSYRTFNGAISDGKLAATARASDSTSRLRLSLGAEELVGEQLSASGGCLRALRITATRLP